MVKVASKGVPLCLHRQERSCRPHYAYLRISPFFRISGSLLLGTHALTVFYSLAVFISPNPSAMYARIPRNTPLTDGDTSSKLDDRQMIRVLVCH